MKNIVLTIVLFMLSFCAFAADVTVSWDTPTQYEDSTALPANEISSYKIYYGQTSNGPYTYQVAVPGNINTVTITNLAKGNWYFVATTIATNGLESAYSVQVSKTILNSSKPRPPQNLR